MKIPTSDPGTSAILTPTCKTDGLYFNDSNEPEDFKYHFDKDVFESIIDQAKNILVKPSFNSIEKYFDYASNVEKMEELMNDTKYNNIHLIDITSMKETVTESDDDDEETSDFNSDSEFSED